MNLLRIVLKDKQFDEEVKKYLFTYNQGPEDSGIMALENQTAEWRLTDLGWVKGYLDRLDLSQIKELYIEYKEE